MSSKILTPVLVLLPVAKDWLWLTKSYCALLTLWYHQHHDNQIIVLLSQWEDCNLDWQMILFFLIEQLIVYSVPAINVNEKPLSLLPYPWWGVCLQSSWAIDYPWHFSQFLRSRWVLLCVSLDFASERTDFSPETLEKWQWVLEYKKNRLSSITLGKKERQL